ncbi:MAG: hypothetical protein ACREDR_03230, partial [Blastocatellia bacterium]
MESAFLGEAYASRSAVLSSQTAINIYPELLKPGSPDIGGFYGCPGRKSVFTGVGQVRGLWNAEGNYYAVVGNTVYQFS